MENSTLTYNGGMRPTLARCTALALSALLAALVLLGCGASTSAPAPDFIAESPPTSVPVIAPPPAALASAQADLLDQLDDDTSTATSLDSTTNDAPPSEVVAVDPTTGFPTYPLPDGNPPPLGPGAFATGFRNPLPASPVWNPPGRKRIGLQAGHWLTDQTPPELARLSPGTSAGGWAEWQVNLMIAQKTAEILEAAGYDIDLLPTTIPVRYRAQAFVAIHADGDISGALHGFKITRPGFSSIPAADDQFVSDLNAAYGAATGLPRDDPHISLRMTYYYAFNTRRYQHAIDLGTPAAIIETGFLTNAGDRSFLTNHPEVAAQGLADGIQRFLNRELGSGR
ncbi:MAG: hypothetical protein QOF51_612 [Chloroflexota bacterium]|jgi:N-acetylmuramoyl-L-alanine amidase|nr:hypothetical protein [Chloroflexota bacterium]